MSTPCPGRRCGSIIALILVFAAISGLAQATAVPADEPGVWQPHSLDFYYLGFTATYSCEGLDIDLRGLLKQSGAQQIAVTTGGPCGGAKKLLLARLKFSTLKPAGPPGGDRGQIVPGSWHHVTISPKNLLLQGGSCELVQEFRRKILPLFDARHIKADLNCVPFQSTGYLFSLSFDVFGPANANLSGAAAVP